MGVLDAIFNLPPDDRSEEEKKIHNLYLQKLNEYKEHFGDIITTVGLCMSDEELIQNIDKCIKHNRKWEGYIVPELDYNDVDI